MSEEAYQGSRLGAEATEATKWLKFEHRDCGVGGVHFFKFLIFDWWIEFGKIRGTVCREFNSGAIVDKSNWGLSER